MASEKRQSNVDLKKEIQESGHRYQFFSAVQALHRLSPLVVPVGELGPFSQEPVHFRHSTALHFHPGDVENIEIPAEGPARLTSTFLGLFGAASPLATHFSEDVIEAEQDDQPTLRAFYDIFHHRLISLYYRAWKKYRLQAGFRLNEEDSSTKRMLCMVGVDAYGARAESCLSRLEILELAPLLSMRARPPRVLILAIRRLLPGVDVTIEQFVERRAEIDPEDRMQLGRKSNRLGRNFTLGARVLDRSARFRIIMGPMDYDTCETFIPGGARYPILRRVIEQFSRGTLECEVDLLLNKNEIPRYCLASSRGGSLGVSTRLGAPHSERSGRMRVLLTDRAEDARAVLIDSNVA